MDCIIVGFNEIDLQTVMANHETAKHISGGYWQMLNRVVEFRGKWLHYMNLLNAVLREAKGKDYRLNVMEMPNLAICHLKAYLARRNFNVEVVNFFNTGKDQLAALLKDGPRAVAINTTYYVEGSPIAEIVRFIRQHSAHTKIIVGGPHIFDICSKLDIVTQDYLLENMGADLYIYDSQGEKTLSSLLYVLKNGETQNLSNIPNLVFRPSLDRKASHVPGSPERNSLQASKTTSFIRTHREIEANNMDENVIDWRYFSEVFYTPTVLMRTARSCAFACSFCKWPVMAGPLTLTSLEVIEQEMKQLYNAGVRNILFVDDTFNFPLPRFKNVLRMIIRNKFNFKWFSFFRCANSDDETFDLMKESGCTGVLLGIESGDQRILKNMNKKATVDRYKHGIRQLNERDIITCASFIIGFPGETRETVQNTKNFIEETQPTFYQLNLYFHDISVPIHREKDKFGIRGGAFSWRHNTMDWKEANDVIREMYTTITGSIIMSTYQFNLYSIPYLLGQGISLEHVKEFLRLCQPLLLRNFHSAPTAKNDNEENIYQELFSIGRKIAADIETNGKAPSWP